MKDLITEVSKDELRHIAITGAHLHTWQGNGSSGLRDIIKSRGLIQLDPLNPAGRYHDLFFLARLPDYMLGQFEQIAYAEKLVFEAYSPNLSAISIEHFPVYFSEMVKEKLHPYYKRKIDQFEDSNPGLLEKLYQIVQDQGSIRSADLAHLGKADPSYASWKSSRVAGSGLEYLWLLGRLAVVRRNDQFHKTYDLSERYVPERYYHKIELSDDEFKFQRFKIQQQSFSLRLLGNFSVSKGKLRFGKTKFFSAHWLDYNEELRPHIVQLEGTRKAIAVPPYWKSLLDQKYDDEIRALGPLDPLIWDRELTKLVFNFDYTWEVYKKPNDRKWGYYVYPILYHGTLIGRLEAKFNKKTKELTFFNASFEKDLEMNNKIEKALENLFIRWKNMLQAEEITTDSTVMRFYTVSNEGSQGETH
ncbi:MAG: DNA glycosylase AlkZ-like family protein [Candidatus Hodarchaeota archaeon]